MATKSWTDLDPRLRRAMVIGGALKAGLKVATLIDLAQRPPATVRGSKRVWAAALILVNSAGVAPIVYVLRGRRVS